MNKKSTLVLVTLITFGLATIANYRAAAQTPPAGEFHVTVSNPESVIWELTGFDRLVNQEIEIEDRDGDEFLEAYFACNTVVQNGSGKVSGSGKTMFSMEYASESGWKGVPAFEMVYKLTGSISSTPGKGRGTYTTTLAGKTFFEGGNRSMAASKTVSFTIDNAAKTVSGTQTSKASASGLSGIGSVHKFGPTTEYLPHNAGWNLDINLPASANGKTITGTATATLHSGQVYPFAVKGTYNAKSQQSKLVLTGKDLAKGSSLQVTLAGGTITLIKGKISGQFVNTQF